MESSNSHLMTYTLVIGRKRVKRLCFFRVLGSSTLAVPLILRKEKSVRLSRILCLHTPRVVFMKFSVGEKNGLMLGEKERNFLVVKPIRV